MHCRAKPALSDSRMGAFASPLILTVRNVASRLG
jgi:hypothetical protein